MVHIIVIYKECEQCGKTFFGTWYQTYCSDECGREHYERSFIERPRKARDMGSKFEEEVYKEVKALYPDTVYQYPIFRILGEQGYTIYIDIFVPCKKLCIECYGWYWHQKTEYADRIKTVEVENRGYRMVRIPEREWSSGYKNIFRYI